MTIIKKSGVAKRIILLFVAATVLVASLGTVVFAKDYLDDLHNSALGRGYTVIPRGAKVEEKEQGCLTDGRPYDGHGAPEDLGMVLVGVTQNNPVSLIVNLGVMTELEYIRVEFFVSSEKEQSTYVLPGRIEVSVSHDNTDWSYVKDMDIPSGHNIQWAELLPKDANGAQGRFVKLDFYHSEYGTHDGSDFLMTQVWICTEQAPDNLDPVVTLGAKVNQSLSGLRFGAEYNKPNAPSNYRVYDMGFLLFPWHKMKPGAVLDMDFYEANAYDPQTNPGGVIKVRAVGVASEYYDSTKYDIEYYDYFVYYATLINIPDIAKGTQIVAVPFISTSPGATGEMFYGQPIIRSFNEVAKIIY